MTHPDDDPPAPPGDAPPPYTPPTLTPPRWLAALSITVGAVLFFTFLGQLWPREAADQLGFGQQTSLMGIALFFHAGYVIAPFWIGRGPWLSFFAGLLLGPVAIGWMLQFMSVLFAGPVVAVLGLLGLAAILGQYFLIFRHFWIDFQTSRKTGGPDTGR